jgi:hypothetical protein
MLHVCFRKFAHLSGSLSSLFTAPKSRPSKLLATSKFYQSVIILPKLHSWINLPETLFLNPVDIQRGHPLMLERKLILAGSTNWPPLPDKTCSTIAVVTSSGSKTGSLNFGCAVSSWINGVRIQVGLTTLQSQLANANLGFLKELTLSEHLEHYISPSILDADPREKPAHSLSYKHNPQCS